MFTRLIDATLTLMLVTIPTIVLLFVFSQGLREDQEVVNVGPPIVPPLVEEVEAGFWERTDTGELKDYR